MKWLSPSHFWSGFEAEDAGINLQGTRVYLQPYDNTFQGYLFIRELSEQVIII